MRIILLRSEQLELVDPYCSTHVFWYRAPGIDPVGPDLGASPEANIGYRHSRNLVDQGERSSRHLRLGPGNRVEPRRRALQEARAEVQSLRRRPPQGISDASRQAADALRRELGGSAPDAKRVDALKERVARLESERDALRKQLARAPKASVELNALRAEVQAARDEALRARTDLAAGGDLSGRLAAAEDRAATLTSLNAGLVRKCERLLAEARGPSL